MTNNPIECKECGHIFSNPINIGPGSISMGNITTCPNCKNMTPIPNSLFPNLPNITPPNPTIRDSKDFIGIGLGESFSFIQQLLGGFDHICEFSQLEHYIELLLRNYNAFFSNMYAFECWRGRKVTRERLSEGILSGGEFTKASGLSYTPPDKTKDYGRCHRPNNPVFYASSFAEPIFSELNIEEKDFVMVGFWQSCDKDDFRFYHLGALDFYRKTKNIPRKCALNENYEEFSGALKKEVDDRLLEKKKFGLLSMLIDGFLSEVFAKPAKSFKEYKLTNVISNYLFSKREFDILGYPSIKHYGSLNFAIRSEIIDQYFKLTKVVLYKVERLLGFGLYGTTKIAEITIDKADENIDWPVDDILSKI